MRHKRSLLEYLFIVNMVGLMSILCAASCRGDYIRADVKVGLRPHDPDTWGVIVIHYDPSDESLEKVYFATGGENNNGIFGRDLSPDGWIDLDAPVRWDLTIDGIGGQGVYGPTEPHPDQFVMDGLRLVNNGDESYVSSSHPTFGQRAPAPATWENVTINVPEPSSLLLLLIGCCIAMSRRYR